VCETTARAYKVLTADEAAALQSGMFLGTAVDRADGFIHLSTASQLAVTVARHFSGQSNLVVAAVDVAAFGSSIRWERSRDGQHFPHLYGALSWTHVIAQGPLEWRADGTVRLPSP
jgi:uncharacterized protein (DUF952 family)